MNLPDLSVRELQEKDIWLLTEYWLNADDNFLKGLGVDVNKMPAKHEWISMLTEQLNTPLADKKSYCIIWLLGGVAIGHSNINKIIFLEKKHLCICIYGTPAYGNKD